MNWKQKLQKYYMVICLCSSILVLTGFGIFVGYAKQANLIDIKDTLGTRDFLKDFYIEGYIGDENFMQLVSIKDGQAGYTFIDKSLGDWEWQQDQEDKNNFHISYTFVPSNGSKTKKFQKPLENPSEVFSNYDVSENAKASQVIIEADSVDMIAQMYHFHKQKETNKKVFYRLRFRSGIVLNKETNNQKPMELKTNLLYENGSKFMENLFDAEHEPTNGYDFYCATIGDTYYFTIPVSTKFRGVGGIYRINTFAPDSQIITEPEKYINIYDEIYNEEEQGTVSTIVEVPLDGKTQIFGMEAIDGKLVLLKGIDNNFIIDLYTEQGELLDSLQLPDSFDASQIKEYKSYVASVGETNSISLQPLYQYKEHADDFINGPFASILITDSLKLAYYIEDTADEGYIVNAALQGDKLLLITQNAEYILPQIWAVQNEAIQFVGFEPTADLKGKKVYDGMLITDIKDDCKKYLVNYQYTDVGPISLYNVRGIGDFDIKGGNTNDNTQ